MSCVLFTNNTSGVALAAGAQVPPGSVVHRKGRAATLEGNEIIVRGGCSDYATVTGNANLIATTAGDVALTVYVDDVLALTATDTVAAEGDYANCPFTLVLKGACCGFHRITFRVGAAVSVNSFPVTVKTVG